MIAEPGGFGRCHWREARGFRAYRWRRGRGACPRDRQARMDQRERADKTEPTLAAEPIENAEASEPTDPTDRIEPAEPMDRIEPDEPIDRIDPLDPMLKMEPADPGERDEPAGICITIFWQARHQPDIGLSAATWPHRARKFAHRAACEYAAHCLARPSCPVNQVRLQ